MTWLKLDLGQASNSPQLAALIHSRGLQFFLTIGDTPDKGVFSLSKDGKFTYYFSPALESVGRAFEGVEPCEPPTDESLRLEFGNWTALP